MQTHEITIGYAKSSFSALNVQNGKDLRFKRERGRNKEELGVVTHDMEFNVSVFTRMFDEDVSNKYAYGKNNIEDLHYIHHKRDNEKHHKHDGRRKRTRKENSEG
jgi:hypothetical protein